MRVLVCPTEFKESLDVLRVVDAMSTGVLRAHPAAAVRRMPVSDGGPGLVEAVRHAGGGKIRHHAVTGPLGGTVTGRVLDTPADETVIESADACGLHLMPPERRDPLHADTRGVGELVLHAAGAGTGPLVVGLGGSGTVDGGTGMAAALGYRLLDADGRELLPGGGSLAELARIEPPQTVAAALASRPVIGVTDVRTPLIGREGAAATFSPQKGADREAVELLEWGLTRLAERVVADLGRDVAGLAGSGAAGGLAAGCAAFLDAELVPGSDWVLSRLGFDAALAEADLVVTGEGTFDATSGLGKVVWEIVRRCADAAVPVVLACGSISGVPPHGVRAIDGGGAWLASDDVAAMVAEAAG